MKLTPFGEKVRHLRMRYDSSLKSMADAMGISPSYLSGIEYGDRRLTEQHTDQAVKFLSTWASTEELQEVRQAAEASRDIVMVNTLTPDARGLVAAFARRLQEGNQPTPELEAWIKNRKG